MTLKPVNDILGVLVQEKKWQEQPFFCLVKCWAEVVGTVIARQTRPLSIQRDVLRVATSSSVWAQNLTFGRPALIVKLNKHLPQPLSDIRFSPAEWQRLSGSNTQSLLSFPEHPSYLGEQPDVPVQINPVMENSHSAIQDWARALARRSHHLPLCPECQCPTPVGEIERWLVCAPCAAKLMADPGF